MRVLKFQIRLPSGQVDQLNVEAERVLIGSGAHCEIRLPVDQARVEHVLIELGAAGVFARALSFEPPPMINNIPIQQAPLPPGAVLGVGGCQIYVELIEGGANAGAAQKKQQKSNPIMLVALIAMLGLGGYMFLFADQAFDTTPPAPREYPELWDGPVTTCPYTEPSQAGAYARERMAVADAKRERRPFHVQSGIQAVPIYEQAGACFRVSRDAASANLADESAKFLRRDIVSDYRTRRVRLKHMMDIEDDVAAQREVRTLLQFTEGKTGEYVTWLQNLERKLKLKVGAGASGTKT